MIERDTISELEFQSLLKQVRKTLPGAVGRTDVKFERKREIVLETILRRAREWFGIMTRLGVRRTSGEPNSHFQNVYNEICRLICTKGQFRAEQYLDEFLHGLFGKRKR